jgi:Fe-S cluster biogenesis protein NfuA
MREKVAAVLDKIRPSLQADGGNKPGHRRSLA